MAIYANINVSMPRDPRMISLGLTGRGLYVECVLYCRENLTDGVIDRLVLPLIAPDVPVPQKRRLLARMVDVGALEAIPAGWRIPPGVWRRWNPTKADVDAKRDAETERKRQWKERRRDNVATTSATSEGTDRDTCRDRQPEPEPEPELSNSPHNPKSAAAPSAEGEPSRHGRIATTYARHELDQARHRTTIRDEPAFLATARTRALTNPDLDRLATLFPTAPDDVIAAAMRGEKHSLQHYPRADELAPVIDLHPQDPASA